MFNRIAAIVALAGSSIGALGASVGRADEEKMKRGEMAEAVEAEKKSRIYGAANIARYIDRVRQPVQRRNYGMFDNRINRHTGQPHFHQREIVRRMTKPGTPERKAGMEAIRHGNG